MSYPRYPAYKPSGVEWLGEVPAHWEVLPIKRLATLRSGDDITSEYIEDSGQYPVYGGNGLRGYTTSYTHEGRYVLIGRQGALCGNINYAEGRFWASEHAVVATPITEVDTTWLGELFRAMNLNQYSISAAQPGLAVSLVSNIRIPIPPLDEQRAIAAFLDRETAQIDALIAKLEQLSALLQEKRQALISHAVTKGLDPTVPMKDSGVEWLGEVPSHWEITRLRYVGEPITGLTYQPSDVVDEGLGTLVLRSSNVQDGKISLGDNVFVTTPIPNELYTKAKDILICSRNGSRALIGKNALISDDSVGLTWGAFMTVFRSEVNDFCYYIFNSTFFDFQSAAFTTSTINQLTIGMIKDFEVAIPPRHEQVEISGFLRLELESIRYSQEKAKRLQVVLEERRAALITAAVTGSIDVRSSS